MKLKITHVIMSILNQPPSGGCVLKPQFNIKNQVRTFQPPSGGCVLKLKLFYPHDKRHLQPPSGGCVLKQYVQVWTAHVRIQPPSGGCVLKQNKLITNQVFTIPAAFRRLCVETADVGLFLRNFAPAAFRRLCVETTTPCANGKPLPTSRLQAAVC